MDYSSKTSKASKVELAREMPQMENRASQTDGKPAPDPDVQLLRQELYDKTKKVVSMESRLKEVQDKMHFYATENTRIRNMLNSHIEENA